MHQQQAAFENIVGKGEIAHKEQFLLFPQCFLLHYINVSRFVHIFDIVSIFYLNLKSLKGLTAKAISWLSVTHVFPGFLKTVLTQISFQCHRFSHILQRREAKIHLKESLPPISIQLATTRS